MSFCYIVYSKLKNPFIKLILSRAVVLGSKPFFHVLTLFWMYLLNLFLMYEIVFNFEEKIEFLNIGILNTINC